MSAYLSSCAGSLDANRRVPFRLTPPLQSFITQIGITGPLQLSMLATARCFVQPLHGLDSILRAILRDEYIAWKKVRMGVCGQGRVFWWRVRRVYEGKRVRWEGREGVQGLEGPKVVCRESVGGG